MAHKKAQGSTSYGRDSQGQRLGVKLYAGEVAQAGSIIVRQRGSKIRPGTHVRKGVDDTLYADSAGKVRFRTATRKRFDGNRAKRTFVDIIPESESRS